MIWQKSFTFYIIILIKRNSSANGIEIKNAPLESKKFFLLMIWNLLQFVKLKNKQIIYMLFKLQSIKGL